MKKNFIRQTSEDILESVRLFCLYHDMLHEQTKNGYIRSSVDRGAFTRPEEVLPKDLLKYLGECRNHHSYAYGPEKGDETLRQKIAEVENIRHGTSYNFNNIAMMPGAWSGLEFAMEEILNLKSGKIDHDKVLVIGPTLYQMFHNPIKHLGMNIIAYNFVIPGEQHVPKKEDIDEIFSEKPKIIVITNPNNPDGKYVPNDVLKE